MKNRFRLIQRGLRGGTFYCVDSQTGRRESLGTKDSDEAAQLVLAKNQSVRQPALSLQMAKAFLSATDDALAKRTWQQAIDTLVESKFNSTKARWLRSVKHAAFDPIRQRPHHRNARRAFPGRVKGRHALDQPAPAPDPELRPRPQLAAAAHHPAPPMAEGPLPRPSRHHPRASTRKSSPPTATPSARSSTKSPGTLGRARPTSPS